MERTGGRAAASALGPDRRRARRDPANARPRAERPRARHVQRDVERALLVQDRRKLAAAHAADRGRRTCSPGRARTPAWCASATAWPSRSRSNRTTTRAPSSPTRARRPASAASCATSSRWARARSRCSTRSSSAGPTTRRTRRLVNGVVRGVGGYGNCVGVPTVGGELTFDPTYTDNPLVNVMCVGVLPEDRHLLAPSPRRRASLAVLFGSATGRDGIGGASVLASADFDEGSAAMRPSVQIGDPFAGKLLIEATPRAGRARARRGHAGSRRGRPDLRDVGDWPIVAAPASRSICAPCRGARRAWSRSR